MIVEPEAVEELFAAAAWYDEQRPGLGDEFLAAVDEVLERVAVAPLSYPKDRFDDRARRAFVRRSPFAAVFVVQDGEIRVIRTFMRNGSRTTGPSESSTDSS